MAQFFEQVINTEYKEIEKYASFINRVSAKNRNYISAISNAYILAQKHTPETYQEAKAIILHYTKCELLYTKTATEKEKITCIDNDNLNNITVEESEHLDFHNIIEVEISKWNFIDKSFFEKYMDIKRKGGSCKTLAEFYKIDIAYTRRKVSNLKQLIKCKI